MKSTRSTTKIILVAMVSAALLFAGCSKKIEVSSGSDSAKGSSHSTHQASTRAMNPCNMNQNMNKKPSASSVYFAFDHSNLDAAARATLDGYAAWLNANRSNSITIEGNCDERGSREYNLALGQRRADSVRDYLSSRGVSAGRIDTVSFGEERAICKGSGEACWAQNRRGDIVTR
ncbi:MAG: peptidoglycan-associated lipoprotein Pal [Mariprofundus sp.]|nr:peptidoglycan-associated lipoprotein Pal [Mariprofundus sp.]